MREHERLNISGKELLPSTYTEAGEYEIRFYYTGKECKSGHKSVRYTKYKQCAICYHNRIDAHTLSEINPDDYVMCMGIAFPKKGMAIGPRKAQGFGV